MYFLHDVVLSLSLVLFSFITTFLSSYFTYKFLISLYKNTSILFYSIVIRMVVITY